MASGTEIAERAMRLHEVAGGVDVARSYPLLVEGRVPPPLFDALLESVRGYLNETLRIAFPDRRFSDEDDPIATHRDDVLDLPNRTPNGLILAKRETCAAYDGVHACVVSIAERIDLLRHVRSVQLPICVRTVAGAADRGADRRPLATTKFHSDVWGGELPETLMVFIPVLGATEVGIEFREPDALFPDEFLRPRADYSEGEHLLRGSRPYAIDLRPGHVYLTDPLLLHRTVRRSPKGMRLSIDFRFRPLTPAPGDIAFPTDRLRSYVEPEVWIDVGRGSALSCDLGIEQPDVGGGASPYRVVPG